MHFFFLILAFCLNALGNIFLKLGSEKGFNFPSWNPLRLISVNYFFVLGLLFFAANVIFYFLALKYVPLSVAYMIMVAMSFVIISGFSYFYLLERFNFWQMMGFLLIFLGIFMVLYFQALK